MKDNLTTQFSIEAPVSSNGAKLIPLALTIAGSDPTSGAGIQADLKTFHAHGVYGLSVISAITAQDTDGVHKVFSVSSDAVKRQCEVLFADIPVKFIKTGMIYDSDVCSVIADFISDHRLTAIIDTPFAATDGTELMKSETFEVFVSKLLPIAELITPNIFEAEKISGIKIHSKKEMEEAAGTILKQGPKAVLIKGGHLLGNSSSDYFKSNSDSFWLETDRISSGSMHGTGCTLSAAITANLANGFDIVQSVKKAKEFTTHTIQHSIKIGSGQRISATAVSL
jgi:hydroxymethylpyrimidine/phosphomethylpyrimidine kinase